MFIPYKMQNNLYFRSQQGMLFKETQNYKHIIKTEIQRKQNNIINNDSHLRKDT